MRLFTKIFISSLAVLSAAMAVTGGMLIKESFDNSLSREKGVALSEYGHIAYTLQRVCKVYPRAESLRAKT